MSGISTDCLAWKPRVVAPSDVGKWAAITESLHFRDLAGFLETTTQKWSGEPPPAIPSSVYGDFARTGDRRSCETPYLERRQRFAVFAMTALLYPQNSTAEAALWREWEAILAESSWALPAHVPDPSGVDPTCMDLHCSLTAADLAEALSVLGSRVPSEIATRTRQRLDFLFACYAGRVPCHDWGWFRCNHNWNAVTHRGIVGAALAVCEDAPLLQDMITRMRKGLPCYLGGIVDDGGCSEGPSYWAYGFGQFAQLNRLIEARTEGAWSLFEGSPKIRRIAEYGPRFFMETGDLVNFADAPSRTLYANPALWSYLGCRLDLPACLHMAAVSLRAFQENPAMLLDEEHGRFHGLIRFFSMEVADVPPAPASVRRRGLLPDLGVWMDEWSVEGGGVMTVVVKGGHNAEHHNHNDCGTVLLFLNGHRLIGDLGYQRYSKAYFRQGRYSFLATRSWGHGVPVVNGCEQLPGKAAAASLVGCDYAHEESWVEWDLTRCYPMDCGASSIRRKVTICAEPLRVRVQDSFELQRLDSLETALLTHGEVERLENGAILSTRGQRALLSPLDGTSLERIDALEYEDRVGAPILARRLQWIANDALSPRISLGFVVTFPERFAL
ncbi:MAG: heparinase II/III family protein [Candidatus Methylacidiphilales bacterium]|nr:heparinase II/III family protein [Candidatus Methylacidiphilales bacterium]